MAGIPANCDICGLSFGALGIIGGTATRITFKNSRVTCPRCGSWARIKDGVYDLKDDVLTLIRDLPQDELAHVRDALRHGVDEDWSPERVADEIEQSSPQLAGVAAWIRERKDEIRRNQLSLFLAVVLFVLAWYQAKQPVQVAQQQLEDAIQRVPSSVAECATADEVEDAVRTLIDPQ